MVHHERSGSASVYRWLAGEEDPRDSLIDDDTITDFFFTWCQMSVDILQSLGDSLCDKFSAN